jgi:hypothetical protein
MAADAPRRLVTEIRHRLDPDAIHPARLAGTHAWAAWGLTDHADPQRLELAIPARYPDSYAKALMGRIADSLAAPLWPDTHPPPIHVHDRTVRSLDDGESFTIEILSLSWYQPKSERRPAGETVTLDRWPIIDETAATRQRLESITTHGATSRDVTDIARWTRFKTARGTAYPTAATPIGNLLAKLRRDAPAAIDGLDTVIDHARTTYQQHGDPDSIREAFQTLTNELARIPTRRDRVEMMARR